ncbi:hypothetical protein BKA00_006611 [Actinomadura coerulea]|uniref:Uncharacterized protein n=1 Tax=Actinomadura coerulea TaxID=46159 RepID=A0A7X0G6R2_9ACTN|nr:hypothetical protein [Actinomadura coerulea]MBB6399697.1 hypothetical protein [Actinomadura coerulea]GGQ11871.1 hypothetical protein GCM10010187_30020 [Actinomadura coerulea]
MAEVSGEDIAECAERINALWGIKVSRSGHERSASEAAANLMSGTGLLYESPELLEMLERAIEVGYAAALSHVEDGRYDDDIRDSWRTELFE